MAVNRDGDVLVADNGVGAVMVFESSGKLKKKIGRKGTRRGDFKEMSSLCIGEEGEIIVADTRILIFNAAGEFLKELGGPTAGAGKEAGRGRYSGVALDSRSGLLLAAKMEKTRSYIQVTRMRVCALLIQEDLQLGTVPVPTYIVEEMLSRNFYI